MRGRSCISEGNYTSEGGGATQVRGRSCISEGGGAT